MRTAAIVWLFLLVAMCLSPFDVKAHLHTQGRLHQAYHVIAFFVTGYLLASSARSRVARIPLLLIACAFAPFTEWLEHCIWGNPLEWRDIWTDLCGVVLALLAMLIIERRATRQAQSLQPIRLVSIADVPQSTPEHRL